MGCVHGTNWKNQVILFCGDMHGQFDHVIEAVQAHRPTAVILLGDMQAQRPLEAELAPILDLTEVWFIPGNHDTDSDADHDNLFDSALADRNLHGRVVEISGVRVAGLGGVFRGQVWSPPAPCSFETPRQYLTSGGKGIRWRDGLPRKYRSSIFPADYQRLAGQRADILVTHEAPSAHPHGFAAIDELARSLRVTRSFHGHHHDRLDYSAERTRLGFSAFGVGLRGITDQDGLVVRTGELDDARQGRVKLA